MKNTDKKNILISLGVGFLGVIMIIIPVMGWVDMMDFGGAMIMVGLLLAITGPIVSLLFWHRSSVYDSLMKSSDLLADWTIDQILWQRFIADEKNYRREDKRGMQLIILFFSVLFGTIFWWADPENGWVVALAMLVLNIIIAITAWLTGFYLNKWTERGEVKCRIGEKGLILADQLHVWTGWGARLEGTNIKPGQINLLEITYSTPNRYSRQYYTIRIPIPAGEEIEAEEVAKKLSQDLT